MSEYGAPRLMLVLDALSAAARVDPEEAIHLRAYVSWMLSLPGLPAICEEAGQATGARRSYRHVAALGYAAAREDQNRLPPQALRDGLLWLAGRNYFVPDRPLGLEADGLALLGIALGVVSLAPDAQSAAVLSWIRGFVPRSIAVAAESWDRALMYAAGAVLGQTPPHAEAVTSDLWVALTAKGVAQAPSEDDEELALASILSLEQLGEGAARAATQFTALQWLIRTAATIRPGRITTPDVVSLLEGIQRSLRRWPWEERAKTKGGEAVRWPINNEYHVQDLLWIVLAPVFPDLEDEESLPSLGQKHPRYDLGVPSLKLIVEAKFVREGTRRAFSGVIEEVAADASLYLRDPERYREIIAFVWDNSRQTQEHSELRQGLLAIPGVVGAVVIPRPGKMT